MKRLAVVLIVIGLAALQITAWAAQSSTAEQRALRERLQERFDIVALSNGIGLRPKSAQGDVRLVEVTDGAILINGTAVSGQELRERLGAGADAVLQASYLAPDARRALATGSGESLDPDPPIESHRAEAEEERPSDDKRHASRDRIRIFGDVTVRGDELIQGDAVAVLGSVRVDGEVRGEVVSVLGSVVLGPKAIVHRDVVSVGGRVRRAEGTQIRGSVTEVSVADPDVRFNFEPLVGWRGFQPFDGLEGLPWLVGTVFRFMLLVLLASIALVIARPTVEASAQRVSDRPLQTALVGFAAELLLVPAFFLIALVLAISIIGIPLLLLLPFAILLLVLFALAGFSGTVYAVGQGTRRRLNIGNAPPIVDIFLGVAVILMPVLLARFVALAGWPGAPFAVPLLVIGFAIEFAAWASGFGAVLTNGLAHWQARRAAKTVA